MIRLGILGILGTGVICALIWYLRRKRRQNEAEPGERENILLRVISHANEVKDLLAQVLSPQLEEEINFEAEVRRAGRRWQATLLILNKGPIASRRIAERFEYEFGAFMQKPENEIVYLDIATREENADGTGLRGGYAGT